MFSESKNSTFLAKSECRESEIISETETMQKFLHGFVVGVETLSWVEH